MNTEKSDKPKEKGGASKGSLKEAAQKRRQVFKPILDNPYTQSNLWPEVRPQDATNIEQLLCLHLSPLGRFNEALKESKSKLVDKDRGLLPDQPSIASEMTIGFNSTVKALEEQASVHRMKLKNIKKHKESDNTIKKAYIKYVFVAKSDIRPPLLIQSFPTLAFTASKSAEDRVKLVELPKGAMNRLSDSLKIPNTSIIGMTENVKEAGSLYNMIESNITDVKVPWLESLFDNPENLRPLFHKPALKVLATSAPIASKKNKKDNKEKDSQMNSSSKSK